MPSTYVAEAKPDAAKLKPSNVTMQTKSFTVDAERRVQQLFDLGPPSKARKTQSVNGPAASNRVAVGRGSKR